MISGILLGAGESKRMGRNKLILPVGKTTLFERCLQTLMNSRLQELVVVLSPRNGELAEKLNNYPPGKKKKFKLVTNSRFKQGISTSIVTGIRSIDGESTGALICLGDQPFLKTSTVNALLRAFQRKKGLIVVPVYRGKRGNPVQPDSSFKARLASLYLRYNRSSQGSPHVPRGKGLGGNPDRGEDADG